MCNRFYEVTHARRSCFLLALAWVFQWSLSTQAFATGTAVANHKPHPAVPAFYNTTAIQYNIPPVLLFAIALTESEYKKSGMVGAWPWTANIKGAGTYYDSKREAFGVLNYEVSKGNDDFGVGPMQVHWSYHKDKFNNNLWTALDPYKNITVGAYILAQLYNETQDWAVATGRYHSNTPKFSEPYKARVLRNIARIKKKQSSWDLDDDS